MPRTALTKTVMGGSFPGAGVSIAWNASDVANGNKFVPTGREFIIVRNVSASTAYSVTLKASNDPFWRSTDITESIPASTQKVFGPFQLTGWQQVSGDFEINATNAAIEVAVVVLPW